MAELSVGCDFLKIAENAQNRASGEALQKRSVYHYFSVLSPL